MLDNITSYGWGCVFGLCRRWDRVVHWADKVLELDGENLKARQRRARGAWESKQLSKAEEDVAFVLGKDPTHAPTLKIKAAIDKQNKAYKDKEAAAFKGMFGGN